ncbi:MAG: VOC family protein [Candidatus Geothermarchaeales archaeon]
MDGNAVVCFETDDIKKAKRELERNGAEILGGVFEDEHICLLVFEDLYGNHLHIFERK